MTGIRIVNLSALPPSLSLNRALNVRNEDRSTFRQNSTRTNKPKKAEKILKNAMLTRTNNKPASKSRAKQEPERQSEGCNTHLDIKESSECHERQHNQHARHIKEELSSQAVDQHVGEEGGEEVHHADDDGWQVVVDGGTWHLEDRHGVEDDSIDARQLLEEHEPHGQQEGLGILAFEKVLQRRRILSRKLEVALNGVQLEVHVGGWSSEPLQRSLGVLHAICGERTESGLGLGSGTRKHFEWKHILIYSCSFFRFRRDIKEIRER